MKNCVIQYLKSNINSRKVFSTTEIKKEVFNKIGLKPYYTVDNIICEVLKDTEMYGINFTDYVSLEVETRIYYVPKEKLTFYKETLDMKLNQQVESFLIKKIQKNEMFTAYDVTKELRREFPTNPIYHDEVKQEIESLYEEGLFATENYMRTSTNIFGNTYAYVYHGVNDDPKNYNSGIPNTYTGITGIQGGNSSALGIQKPSLPKKKANKGNNITVDPKGRIRIGKKALSEAGFLPYETAYVLIKNDEIAVMHDSILPNKGVKPYIVDKYTNIRLSVKSTDLNKKSNLKTTVRGNPDPKKHNIIPGQKGSWVQVK